MSVKSCKCKGWVFSAIFFGTIVAQGAVAPTTSTNMPGTAEITRSHFEDSPKIGKDPFFPNSKRRNLAVSVPVITNTNTSAAPIDVTKFLSLKGVYGKFVMINNVDFAVDEEKNIKLPGGAPVKVKCVEIREKSVVVLVNGKPPPVELRLREGLQ